MSVQEASNENKTLRPNHSDLIQFLKTTQYFKNSDTETLHSIAKAAEWIVLPSSQVLMKQGVKETRVFLIYRGKLRFEKRNADGDIAATGEFQSKDMVGEISFLKDHISVATAYAVRNCEILGLDQKTFEDFLLKNPQIAYDMARKAIHIADRNLNSVSLSPRYTSIALIPLNSNISLRRLSEKFASALKSFGSTSILSKQKIENDLGTGRASLKSDDPLMSENLAWMTRTAEQHDFVLLEAEAEDSPWSRLCVQEADRIFFIAQEDQNDELSQLEITLQKSKSDFSPKNELIILRDHGSHPKQSARFLQKRNLERHHHICLSNQEDFARLARIITGNSIGLALGGGGVKAATQIGLFRCFQEAGIPIDHICGTSIGSLVGAFLAMGMSTLDMEKIIRDKIISDNIFNDYTVPFVSLARGKKFSKFLFDIFNEQRIEDLSIDYFAVATNLSQGTLEVFDKGFVWKGVRASASLPAILPPLVENGNLYVDGGLLDNVPAEVMKRKGVGKVIAVDVSSATNTDNDKQLEKLVRESGTAPAFHHILRNKFSKKGAPYASLGDIIVRSMVLGSREKAQQIKENSDLYIRMPVDDYGMLDFKATSALVNVGYDYSLQHLQEWKNSLKLHSSFQ